MVKVIRVSKWDAKRVIRKLQREGLIDERWSIVEDGDSLLIPVNGNIEGVFEHNLPPRERRMRPYERIVSYARRVGIEKEHLPDYWERIGDVLILPPWDFGNREKDIGEIYARVLNVKTVCVYGGIEGELRVQKVSVIYGSSTETVHVENGIRYKLDVSRIMFSSGNINERIRMSKISADGEVVVDMFSGIGYFTLPVAVYGNPRIIYACEKNPVAYFYLLENIRINGVKNVLPLYGDNRKVCPYGIADRVIMGYIRTMPFLKYGLKLIGSRGVIHYHDTFREEEMPYVERKLSDYALRLGYKIRVLSKRVVKSYAPRIWHLAIDLEVSKI